MAEVSRTEVFAYQRQASKVEADAKRTLMEALSKLDLTNQESWPVTEQAVSALYDAYGSASAELGRQFYQFCHDREVGDKATYLATSDFDYQNTRGPLESQVRYYLERLIYDDWTPEQVTNSLSMTLGDYVQKANRAAILDNLGDEYAQLQGGRAGYSVYAQTRGDHYEETASSKRGRLLLRHGGMKIGYARVPAPDCSCAFCITMASRGFVYWTDETAGGRDPANRFHDHCRCTIVRLDSDNPAIEGYDEDEYRAQYEAARDALKSGDLPKEVYDRIDAAAAQAAEEGREFRALNETEIAMRYMYGMH